MIMEHILGLKSTGNTKGLGIHKVESATIIDNNKNSFSINFLQISSSIEIVRGLFGEKGKF